MKSAVLLYSSLVLRLWNNKMTLTFARSLVVLTKGQCKRLLSPVLPESCSLYLVGYLVGEAYISNLISLDQWLKTLNKEKPDTKY
jgi:hypothetical protein